MTKYKYPDARPDEASFNYRYLSDPNHLVDPDDLAARGHNLLADWVVRFFFPVGDGPPPSIVRSAAMEFITYGDISFKLLSYGRNRQGFAVTFYNPRNDILLPDFNQLGAPQRINDDGWNGLEADIGVLLPERNNIPFIPESSGFIELRKGLTLEEAIEMNQSEAWKTFCSIVQVELNLLRKNYAAQIEQPAPARRVMAVTPEVAEEGSGRAVRGRSILSSVEDQTYDHYVASKVRKPLISTAEEDARRKRRDLNAANQRLNLSERRAALLQSRLNRQVLRLQNFRSALEGNERYRKAREEHGFPISSLLKNAQI